MPICITRPVRNGRDCLHTVPPPPRQWVLKPRGLFIGALNIRDGWVFGIAQAIWAVYINGFDLMIRIDTKIADQSYCCNRLWYDVVLLPMITTADGGEQGGVCLFIQYQTQGWNIESICFRGKNAVRCEVVTDRKRTPIIGAYLLPSTLDHLQDL